MRAYLCVCARERERERREKTKTHPLCPPPQFTARVVSAEGALGSMDVEILLSGFPFPACSVECDARAADSSKYGVAAVAIGACSLFLIFSGESAHFFLLVTPPPCSPGTAPHGAREEQER